MHREKGLPFLYKVECLLMVSVTSYTHPMVSMKEAQIYLPLPKLQPDAVVRIRTTTTQLVSEYVRPVDTGFGGITTIGILCEEDGGNNA